MAVNVSELKEKFAELFGGGGNIRAIACGSVR